MTRAKEIEQAMRESVSETIYACGYGMTPQATDLLECAFTKGAEWADEHPKFSKEEFIEKVKRWLKFETDWDMEYDEEGRNPNYGKIDELIKYLTE